MTLNDMPFGEFLRGKLSVPAKGTECFSKGNTLKSLSLLIVMMVVGVCGAWGQSEGVYYIANHANSDNNPSYTYDGDNPANNFYLVPAKNPQLPDYRDAYYSSNYETSDGDPEKPYLTTFQTNQNINSAWVIKSAGDNKFFLIHVETGEYAVYQTTPDCTGFTHRKVIHLENLTDPDNTAKAKFYIENGNTAYTFRPQSLSGNTNRFFNPSGGNKPVYYGSYQNNFGNCNNLGLIGVFNNKNNVGSNWHLENALLPAPTIDYNAESNTFSISYDLITEGFSILYTTDGSDPTIGGSNTLTYTSESVITKETIGSNPLKAVVVRYGLILTEIASIRTPSNPTITSTPGDCRNTVTITADAGTTVYYTLDETAPNNGSTLYTEPFVLNSDATVKAVAYNGNLPSGITTYSYSPVNTLEPTITQNGTTVTISGNGTIYYTIDGNVPDAGSTQYTVPITVSGNSGDQITIKAVAKDSEKGMSCVAEKTVTVGYYISDITSLNNITSHLNELCIVTADIPDASGLSASISNFTGEFDGGYHTISGLTKPLFDIVDGGTVKNVILDPNATISGNGAICNEADGTAKIYNCGVLSGTVSGTGNVGGLVGHIKSGSSVRVVNCYSYANVSGGSTMAGIVGNNEGTVGDVRIAMCMMYGDMSGGTSPVYAGNHTSNAQNFTEYNFWRSKANLTYTTYNDQLAIDKDEYLTRFPFYRHILNTHRELAAYFLFGDYAEDHVNEIGHWAVKKGDDAHRYPVVEQWEKNRKSTPTQTNNDLPTTTADYAGKLLTTMGTSGYLSVSIKIGSNSYSANLPITDMDTLRYDYTYGKVILPFANEFEVNTDYSKICTGWMITKVGTATTFSIPSSEPYNFADRKNPQKNIWDANGNNYIFAQGGYFIVPDGVTSIEITANFATAYYLNDATYDVGYDANYKNPTPLGGNTPTTFHGRQVYNNITAALAAMSTASSPHTQAIVLVGNYHFPTVTPSTKDDNPISSYTGNAFTLMSIDADNNQEPDYGFYSNNSLDRPSVAPIRFDFVPVISLGMSSHVNGSEGYPGIPTWKPRGWFETTETSLCIMNQFELDSYNFNAIAGNTNNRCVINGGYFVQMVRSRANGCNKVNYFQIGGKAYVGEFYPGSHSDNDKTTVLVPINVTGGEIRECFMTGYSSKENAKASGDNIYFWCAGGKIGKFLGAYMEKPTPKTAEGKVNMTAKIDHALITRFFGGGTSANASITGTIAVTVDNSKVDFYCGGPEFSSVDAAPVVETHATNTVFDKYYGAGFGGTSITYNREQQSEPAFTNLTTTFPLGFTYYTNNRLKGKTIGNVYYGIGTCYKFEYILHSYKMAGVARFHAGYAQFSLATTGSVTNVLNGCTIKNDFYGAGCQGKVNGTVTSTLTDCTIEGNVFGGGYKAVSNEVEVYPTTQPSYSSYNRETGIFSEFGKVSPELYYWEQADEEHEAGSNSGSNLYTDVVMTELGNVEGAISLTINGTDEKGTTIGTLVGDVLKEGTGNVYGGGNESKSLDNTTVILKGNTTVNGNVFGGGNKAAVSGSTTVNIEE